MGAGAVDSDAGIALRTGAITMSSGVSDPTWDAGIYKTAEVLPQVITSTTTVQQTTESLPVTEALGGGMVDLEFRSLRSAAC